MTPHQQALENLNEIARIQTLRERIAYAQQGRALIIHHRPKNTRLGAVPMQEAQ